MNDAPKLSFVDRLLDILQRGRLVLLIALGLIIVGVIGIIVKNQLDKNQLSNAALAMERLETAYSAWKSADDSKKPDSLKLLKKEADSIVAAFPQSFQAQRAHFVLALSDFDGQRFEQAAAGFLLAANAKADSPLAAISLFNAAAAAEQANQLDKSRQYLQRIVTDYKQSSAEAPRAFLALGRIAETGNDFAKALKYYRQLIDTYGDESDWTKIARDRIIVLKTTGKL